MSISFAFKINATHRNRHSPCRDVEQSPDEGMVSSSFSSFWFLQPSHWRHGVTPTSKGSLVATMTPLLVVVSEISTQACFKSQFPLASLGTIPDE